MGKPRFERELLGEFGSYWQKMAIDEIDKMQNRVNNCEILTDENGAAYWKSNGAYLPWHCVEILQFTNFKFDPYATQEAEMKQTIESLEKYRRNHREISDEERAEIRANFGNESVVDIITGEVIQ